MKTPEKIKKGLECCAIPLCEDCPYDGEASCGVKNEDALAYIQQLEQERIMLMDTVSKMCGKTPRWISVEERLPEYGRYLVITRKGNGMTKVQTATYNNMGWWMHANFGEITHWMPLPEPPVEV